MEPFTDARLEWSGDKRVVVSPHGPGTIGLVVSDPHRAQGFPGARNLCISDNRALSDYRIRDFVSIFPTFRGIAALGALAHLPLMSARAESSEARHSEFIAADGVELELTWEGLGEAVAANIPPERSSTRKHQMYSVFRAAQSSRIVVNGKRLPGRSVPRDFHGRPMTSALLALSESWILHPGLAA